MKYPCPLCQTELVEVCGNAVHPGNGKYGITLYCPALGCTAQEVAGHGNKVNDAFEVIKTKFERAMK